MGSSGSVRRDGAFAVAWLPADASEKQQVGCLTSLGDVVKKQWGHLRLHVGLRSGGVDKSFSDARRCSDACRRPGCSWRGPLLRKSKIRLLVKDYA